jgi:putative spermidine/putrescine transport system substrate-binding protein
MCRMLARQSRDAARCHHRPDASSLGRVQFGRCEAARGALLGLLVSALSCRSEAPSARFDIVTAPWASVEQAARGQTLSLAMWQGDPQINAYIQNWVKPRLQERFGIQLEVVSSQGNEIVGRLMSEQEAGVSASNYDILWINGETFYQLRQIEALANHVTDRLPHRGLLDLENPFIAYDFQQPIEGYECPWGNVQLALIYDGARVSDPPATPEALEAWLRTHPGRFTFDTGFTGLTFLKSLMMALAGGPKALQGPFDEATYGYARQAIFTYLNRVKPYFWKEGKTFPERLSQVHQLFVSGEIYFTMSNNDGEVDNKVLQGLFPKTARAYVMDSGSIRNSHYIGLVKKSPHSAAALVAMNFLISPEAQYQKMLPEVWGDGTVLNVNLLPAPWKERFQSIPTRVHVPAREVLQTKALMEPAAEYMIRLAEDFRSQIING